MNFNLLISTPLYLIVALVSVFLLAYFVLRSSTVQELKIRRMIFAVRLVTVLLLLFMLANPIISKPEKEKRENNQTLFLVDSSKSMGIGEVTTRIDEVKNIINPIIHNEKLKKKIKLFNFSDKIDLKDMLINKKLLSTTGSSSNLATSLTELIDENRDIAISNIVVFSDGRIHDRDNLGKAVRLANRFSIPISTYTAGRGDGELFNIAIENCITERHAAPMSKIGLQVILKSQGNIEKDVMITLKKSSGEIVCQKEVKLLENTSEHYLKFSVGASTQNYQVVVTSPQSEITLIDNNFDFEVVVNDAKIRVLYMEGSNVMYNKNIVAPVEQVWAYELMPESWIKSGSIDVDIYTVDTQKQSGGRIYNVKQPSKTIPATKEEFMKYDVVICSDVNRHIFSQDQLKWVVEIVNQRGGGFCMIGGNTSFGSGGWDKTVWEQLIPVDMTKSRTDRGQKSNEWVQFKVVIPVDAYNHPIWKIDQNFQKNVAILKQHPILKGTNLVKRAKPGATVLATHGGHHQDMPVICVQSYGKGRTMAFTSDSAGGWGVYYQSEWGPKGENNLYYQKFWLNAVRWLSENSWNRRRSKLIGNTEAVTYKSGDDVKLSANILTTNDSVALRTHKVIATFILDDAISTELIIAGEGTDFIGKITLPDVIKDSEVMVEFKAVDKDLKLIGTDKVKIRILKTDREFSDITPDHKTMTELAKHTGGKIIKSASELDELLTNSLGENIKEPRIFNLPLWDNKWFLILLIALFTIEWSIRKFWRVA